MKPEELEIECCEDGDEYIFWESDCLPENEGWSIIVAAYPEVTITKQIKYCPFCGKALPEVAT